jgi:superoxide dismutase, Fe-Mn family
MQNDANTLTHDPDFGVFNASSGTFVLPSLPFEMTALAPVTGVETLQVHLTKHHQSYVDAANALLEPMTRQFHSATEVIAFARDTGAIGLLEQSSQALNHAFFWACQQAAGLTRPDGSLEIAINGAFTDFEGFIDAAIAMGKARVGSGWIWLVSDEAGTVSLILSEDAGTVLDDPSQVALLVCDIWEHAYYLDRTSDRAGWIAGFFSQIADWKLALSRYEACVNGEPTKV